MSKKEEKNDIHEDIKQKLIELTYELIKHLPQETMSVNIFIANGSHTLNIARTTVEKAKKSEVPMININGVDISTL